MRAHVTCGRGTEIFVKAELCDKLNCRVVGVEDGKVFFVTSEPNFMNSHHHGNIFKLKTVERIFVTVTHFPTSEIKGNGKVQFLCALKDRILNCPTLPETVEYAQKLKSLQNLSQGYFLHQKSDDKLHTDAQCTSLDAPVLTVNDKFDQKCTQKPSVNHAYQRNSKSVCCPDHSGSYQQYGDVSHNTVTGSYSASMEHQSDSVFCSSEKNLKELHKEPPTDALPTKSCQNLDNRDNEEVRNENNLEDSDLKDCCCLEPPVKKRRSNPEHEQGNGRAVHTRESKTFRISVKCGGWCKKWLQPQRLAREIGIKLTLMTGWTADLNTPDIEICVHVNDDFVTVGIPLTRSPVSKRDYILDSGLRSTISWIMAQQADIQPGHVVLDPMCGKATILVEAARENSQFAEIIGCDIDQDQLNAADRNIKFAQIGHSVQLFQADALNLPFRSGSVDRVVCDAPFGQKFSVGSFSLPCFYRKLLEEMHRVLAPGGLAVLLTSQDLLPVVEKHCARSKDFTLNTNPDFQNPRKNSETSTLKASRNSPAKQGSTESDVQRQLQMDSLSKFHASLEETDHQTEHDASSCDITFAEKGSAPQCEKAIRTGHQVCLQTAGFSTNCSETSAGVRESSAEVESKSVLFFLLSSYYVKLGETHAYIVILQKSENGNGTV